MHVLLVTDDLDRHEEIMVTCLHAGTDVISTSSFRVGREVLRTRGADLIIVSERVNRQLSHSFLLYAEHQNPLVSAILLTDRTDSEVDELFDLIPCVHGLMGRRVSAPMILQFGRAFVDSKSLPPSKSPRIWTDEEWDPASRGVLVLGNAA